MRGIFQVHLGIKQTVSRGSCTCTGHLKLAAMFNIVRLIIITMGQYNSNQLQHRQLEKLYIIIRKNQDNNTTTLKYRHKEEYFLLKEFTFSQEEIYRMRIRDVEARRSSSHVSLTNIIKIQVEQVENICSTLYKIYVLWQYEQLQLAESINKRALEKRFFSTHEALEIFSGIIKGLIFLKDRGVEYQHLTAKNILVSGNRVKLIDPFIIETFKNIENVFHNRNIKNIYLSPEECKLVQLENSTYLFNYKNVVFTAAILMLEVCLLERQDQCYLNNCSEIDWARVKLNLSFVGNKYEQQLQHVLQSMLIQDSEMRWELEQVDKKLDTIIYNTKVKEKRPQISSNIQILNQHSHMKLQNTRLFQSVSHFHHNLYFSDNKVQTANHLTTLPHIHTNTFLQNHHQKSFKPELLHEMKTINNSNYQVNEPMTLSAFNYELNTKPYHHPTSQNKQNNHNKMAYLSTDGFYNSESDSSQCLEQNIKIKKWSCHESGGEKHRKGESQYVIEQFKLGSRYEGSKMNGLRQGYGVFYFQDGGKYNGDWKENKMHGFGRLYYKSGQLAYEGNWQSDQFHGHGKLFNENPLKITSNFDYTNFDQIGQIWLNYEGYFKHDIKQGRGKLSLSNGQYYQGNFECDEISGEGIFHSPPNRIIKAIWRSNQLLKYL